MKRRTFVKNSGLITAGISMAGTSALTSLTAKATNKLPKWKGFNLLDFFSPDTSSGKYATTEEHLKWMQDWGFDFVRLPIAYPHYLKFDRTKNITPEEVYQIDDKAVDRIDGLVTMAHKYGMHASINLHRAPGYCINAGFHEPYNLWTDEAAQDAFNFHWGMWAKRYKNVSAKKISFDLVNEPSMREDMNDQHSRSGPVPGDVYRKVSKRVA